MRIVIGPHICYITYRPHQRCQAMHAFVHLLERNQLRGVHGRLPHTTTVFRLRQPSQLREERESAIEYLLP